MPMVIGNMFFKSLRLMKAIKSKLLAFNKEVYH